MNQDKAQPNLGILLILLGLVPALTGLFFRDKNNGLAATLFIVAAILFVAAAAALSRRRGAKGYG